MCMPRGRVSNAKVGTTLKFSWAGHKFLTSVVHKVAVMKCSGTSLFGIQELILSLSLFLAYGSCHSVNMLRNISPIREKDSFSCHPFLGFARLLLPANLQLAPNWPAIPPVCTAGQEPARLYVLQFHLRQDHPEIDHKHPCLRVWNWVGMHWLEQQNVLAATAIQHATRQHLTF